MTKGTVLSGYTINVKTATGGDAGIALKPGDVVYGEVNASSGRNKIYFSKIYRIAGTIENHEPNVLNANVDNDGSPIVRWMVFSSESEPGTTEPPPIPVPNTTIKVEVNTNDDLTLKDVFVNDVKVYP